MSKFILGSGLVARIAKDLFPSYNFIPFGKSRFYNYDIPIGENYISVNNNISEYVKKFKRYDEVLPLLYEYKRPFSFNGDLYYNSLVLEQYLNKVYGDCDYIASKILSKTLFPVCLNITPGIIYNKLGIEQNSSIIEDLNKYSELLKIDQEEHLIHTKTGIFEYESIISTIPLDALYKYLGLVCDLEAKKSFIYLIKTGMFDFESANELLVSDKETPIYNITKVNSNIYIIKSLSELSLMYLQSLILDIEVLNSTQVPNYIPINRPNLKWLGDDIKPVGSLARWDDFYDISTCINALINF